LPNLSTAQSQNTVLRASVSSILRRTFLAWEEAAIRPRGMLGKKEGTKENIIQRKSHPKSMRLKSFLPMEFAAILTLTFIGGFHGV
jgi:hypothetical protein